MNNADLHVLTRALRAATAAHNIDQLAALDKQLSSFLASVPVITERGVLTELRTAYHEALAVCHADSEQLRHRLIILGSEREGNIAYALISQLDDE